MRQLPVGPETALLLLGLTCRTIVLTTVPRSVLECVIDVSEEAQFRVKGRGASGRVIEAGEFTRPPH